MYIIEQNFGSHSLSRASAVHIGPRLPIVEVSRSHTDTRAVGLLWMTDQLVAEAATCTTHNKHKEANIHALRVIRTSDPSSPAISELYLRPNSHRDGQNFTVSLIMQ
jgi:hypothetical protein